MKKILKVCLSLAIIATMLISVPALAAQTAWLMRVNGRYVNMHSSGTGGGATVIAKLSKGTKVLYWGVKSKDNKQMYKVATAGGKIGYVYKGYLTSYGAMKKNQVYRATSSTPLYKLSGSKMKRNGTLGSGKYCVVYRTSGNWAMIKTMSGKNAYCRLDTLTRAF